MPVIDAFIPASLPPTNPFSDTTRIPPLTPIFPKSTKFSRFARRRLRPTSQAPTPENPPPESSGPSPESTNPHPEPTPSTDASQNRDNDRDVSDLVLPNLKELFAGAGDPDCDQCGGEGVIPCPVCDAKGYITITMMDTTSSTQCRMCRGSRVIPCPSCRDIVYKSVLWWDQIPSAEEDPDENWREGPDGEPRISWSPPPAGPW